ncbi:MAG: hypothetical protein KBD01_05310 [Acidobacteria bacterium]|nr:hypothetical protein [Acidobacteriota bacterium]
MSGRTMIAAAGIVFALCAPAARAEDNRPASSSRPSAQAEGRMVGWVVDWKADKDVVTVRDEANRMHKLHLTAQSRVERTPSPGERVIVKYDRQADRMVVSDLEIDDAGRAARMANPTLGLIESDRLEGVVTRVNRDDHTIVVRDNTNREHTVRLNDRSDVEKGLSVGDRVAIDFELVARSVNITNERSGNPAKERSEGLRERVKDAFGDNSGSKKND